MYIALALQNLWLKAEGTLSSYNRHADFSMGRQDVILLSYLPGAQMRGVWGVSHPPIFSTPGPSCTLMGISRSRSGPVCIEFLFITPLAESSSVGAVIYLL